MNTYKNSNVLVTGGAGFIGSHLVEQLVAHGAQVTVLDNLTTGSLDNLANVIDDITFVQQDITDYQACLQATQNQEIIFHLAAFISVPLSVEQPYECHRSNVDGTVNLLDAATKNNVERFVFSSSAAVYGPTNEVCVETMPHNPTSPYGFSKAIGELYCQQYARNTQLKTVCLRYFNVCGERQNPHGSYAGVVAAFTQRLKNNEPLIVRGDGLQTRDFIPVQQVVQANMHLGLLPAKQMCGDTYNIGTGTSITLKTLIEQLQKKFPAYNQSITFAPARAGDIRHSRADCTKYNKALSTKI